MSQLNSTLDQSQSMQLAEIQPIVPMSKVKTIMKSSPEITTVNTETLYVVCKATVSTIVRILYGSLDF